MARFNRKNRSSQYSCGIRFSDCGRHIPVSDGPGACTEKLRVAKRADSERRVAPSPQAIIDLNVARAKDMDRHRYLTPAAYVRQVMFLLSRIAWYMVVLTRWRAKTHLAHTIELLHDEVFLSQACATLHWSAPTPRRGGC